MAKGRIRIGLIYTFDANWIAGAYYIVNLVQSLKLLEDELKPHIVLLSFNEEGKDLMRQFDYPYLTIQSPNYVPPLPQRIINKFSRMLLGKNICRTTFGKEDFEIVFPYYPISSLKDVKHKVYWIPDFQYEFLPDFFSKDEYALRRSFAEIHAGDGPPLVLSSRDSLNHFKSLYPGSKCALFVLNFAVTHPDFSQLNIEDVKRKFGISGSYFFSPNQFWVHKNHPLIINAISLLNNSEEKAIQVVFSGKEVDHRHPDYTQGLKKEVHEKGLDSRIHFLGFIDRAEQLLLMQHSIAVIQPSLFEGWSTVIEDAKAIGKFVIASDLAVHHEQLSKGAAFFDPQDPLTLAALLKKYQSTPPPLEDPGFYRRTKLKFATDFLNMAKSVLK